MRKYEVYVVVTLTIEALVQKMNKLSVEGGMT